ncbi:hypothetical protein ACRAWD_32080 [Caulobacter segnis]
MPKTGTHAVRQALREQPRRRRRRAGGAVHRQTLSMGGPWRPSGTVTCPCGRCGRRSARRSSPPISNSPSCATRSTASSRTAPSLPRGGARLPATAARGDAPLSRSWSRRNSTSCSSRRPRCWSTRMARPC